MNRNPMMLNLLAAATLVAMPALAQSAVDAEASKGCRAHAALSTGAYYDDIFVVRGGGGFGRQGNFRLTWEAWVTDQRAITGNCDSDPRGSIVRFERLAEKTGRKPGPGAPGAMVQAPAAGGGGFNNTAATPAQQQQQLGVASMDTDGHGNFSGLGLNTALNHSHVTLQAGRALVVLTGGFNRVSFTGQVTKQMSDREFEIAIDGSDRVRTVTGTILLRTTPAHNAAEAIVINGTSGNQQFTGRFDQ